MRVTLLRMSYYYCQFFYDFNWNKYYKKKFGYKEKKKTSNNSAQISTCIS